MEKEEEMRKLRGNDLPSIHAAAQEVGVALKIKTDTKVNPSKFERPSKKSLEDILKEKIIAVYFREKVKETKIETNKVKLREKLKGKMKTKKRETER